ncbi:UPF0149 family protein [Pararhodospirillum oryzae]|uniref:YecA family protein n=1 Tax=Pararhodospirillum oryzae TaxID=478448 RepID=A0A512HA78_9PROT|nr:UPF0149 family protein [Pararhodospirillum oryzae]GEO82339.1 hypothetical protein ROR02_24700 [Pararhodospirillum oryzae]
MSPAHSDLHDDPVLTALDEALRAGGGPVMSLSELDGFLTALAVGPERVPPAEWLPLLWDGAGPHFSTPAAAGRFVEALLARVNAILLGLEDDPDRYMPVLAHGDDGALVADDWAEGFLDGMSLRPEAWAPLIADEDAGLLLAPILSLCTDEQGRHLLVEDGETDEFLETTAATLIGPCTAAIQDYWRSRRQAGPAPEAFTPPPVARNAPCPCGSGKKYKRCCGAAAASS